MTRMELLLLIFKEVDESIASHFANKNISDWPCGPGCSKCCEENFFTITNLEFKLIQSTLRTWNDYHLSRLSNRVDRLTKRLQKYHPEIINFISYLESNRSQLFNVDQTQLLNKYENLCQSVKNLPCPFLDRNMCTIYDSRPLVCRTYGNTYELYGQKIKYNICNKTELQKNKEFLINGTTIGNEVMIISYNFDIYPPLIWLIKAQSDIKFIPNEQRDFEEHFMTLEEFRLLQKVKITGLTSLSTDELEMFENLKTTSLKRHFDPY